MLKDVIMWYQATQVLPNYSVIISLCSNVLVVPGGVFCQQGNNILVNCEDIFLPLLLWGLWAPGPVLLLRPVAAAVVALVLLVAVLLVVAVSWAISWLLLLLLADLRVLGGHGQRGLLLLLLDQARVLLQVLGASIQLINWNFNGDLNWVLRTPCNYRFAQNQGKQVVWKKNK